MVLLWDVRTQMQRLSLIAHKGNKPANRRILTLWGPRKDYADRCVGFVNRDKCYT